MADLRRHDYARRQQWGDQCVTFAKITGDDTYTTLFQIEEDYFASETRDDESGRIVFEFRCYTFEQVASDLWSQADLILFDERRMECASVELKRRTPAHYKVIALPIGAIE